MAPSLEHIQAPPPYTYRALSDLAAALPLLERRLQAAPPPAAEHYAVCKAGCVALAKAAVAVSFTSVPWEVDQTVLMTRTAPFLLGGWQRIAGALTSGAASVAEAAPVLTDLFVCVNLVAQFLGMLGTQWPARASECAPVRRSLAVKLAPWLAPAVNTLVGAANELGGWCGGSREKARHSMTLCVHSSVPAFQHAFLVAWLSCGLKLACTALSPQPPALPQAT